MLLDVATGDHEVLDVPVPRLGRRAEVVGYPRPDGSGVATESASPGGALWSFEPGDETARLEIEGVVRFAVAGDLLAWVPQSTGAKIRVRVEG